MFLGIVMVLLFAIGILVGRKTVGGPEVPADAGVNDSPGKVASNPVPAGKGSDAVVSLDLSRVSDRGLRKMGAQGALSDPIAAIERANELPRMDRYAYLDAVFSAWGEKDGMGAASWISQNLQGSEKADALTSLASGWADSDPEQAAEWFNGNTGGETREEAISEALSSWSRKNPEGALAWTGSLDPNVKTWVMESLAEGWAAVDPAAAAEAGMQFAESDFGHEFLVAVATRWAASDPGAVARWASGIEDTRLQAAIYGDVATEWGVTDPEGALAWVEGIADEKLRGKAEAALAYGWAERDPAAAMDWAVEGVANPKQNQRLIKEVIIGWTEIDPGGAASYIDGLSPGEQTDSILKIFSNTVADLDPYSAISWAGTISNEAERIQLMQKLAQDWIDLDGTSARDALMKMSLPPKIRDMVVPPKK